MLVVLLTNQKDYELCTIEHMDIISIVIKICTFVISTVRRPIGRPEGHKYVLQSFNFFFLCVFFKQSTVTYLFIIFYETFFEKELLGFCFSP